MDVNGHMDLNHKVVRGSSQCEQRSENSDYLISCFGHAKKRYPRPIFLHCAYRQPILKLLKSFERTPTPVISILDTLSSYHVHENAHSERCK